MRCAKAQRKRDKVLSRIRQDKEAKRRKIHRLKQSRLVKHRPGYWLDCGTADIHKAIVTHLKSVTSRLIKDVENGFVSCRLVSPYQVHYSDLAYRNSLAFLEYSKVKINGGSVTVIAQIISRTQGLSSHRWSTAITRSSSQSSLKPLWSEIRRLILADPGLFDELDDLAARMVRAYHHLVEYPNRGT